MFRFAYRQRRRLLFLTGLIMLAAFMVVMGDFRAETLWQELVPLPENKATHWDSLLHKIETDPDTPDQHCVSYNHGASIYQQQRHHFTQIDAPKSCTYRFDGDISAVNKPIIGRTYTIQITQDTGD